MKSERTFYRLANVIDLIGGGTPKTSVPEYWDGNIPWLSVKDFNNGDRYVYTTEKSISQAGLDNSSTKLLTHNDIIISARGTVGELAMIPFPMAFNQSCYGIRGKKGIIVQPYLYYLLKNSICLLKSQTHGSVFDTITSVLQKTVVILYRNMLYLEYGKTINSCTGRRKRDTAHGEA
ncbi:MAG: restriction endonuclease subunit S, partial [Spirochaetota bacterium]|nr:restriction endonuclease subunit S [Spirochaetota bacterium]